MTRDEESDSVQTKRGRRPLSIQFVISDCRNLGNIAGVSTLLTLQWTWEILRRASLEVGSTSILNRNNLQGLFLTRSASLSAGLTVHLPKHPRRGLCGQAGTS